MNATLLALDTATIRAAVALIVKGNGDAPARVLEAVPDADARHGRVLVPTIRDLLAQANLPFHDLDGFVVGLGPGSYTGLRVGLTAAKTFSYVSGKPLAGFDSLALVARNAPEDCLFISAIGDAQRGELYVSEFRRERTGGPLLSIAETRVESALEWASRLPADACVIGPALTVERLAPAIPPHVRRPNDPESNWPDPIRLAELACDVWTSGRRDDVFFLEPTYLRRSAAEDQWEKLGK